MKLLSIRYSRYVGSLLVGMGRSGYVVGGWGEQMLWEAEMFEDLYGAKAESDLTKTQNSWVNNEQTNL